MRPSSSNKYLSPDLVVKNKDSFKEHSFSKKFEILLREHNDDSMSENKDKNKQYYDNFLLALKSENNDANKEKKNRRRGNNRKSVQLDYSSMLKFKNIKPDRPSSPSNYKSKKPAINNINIYITKNKDDRPGSVYSSVKSSEDETKKLIVKNKKNVYYSNFTAEKKEAPNELKKKKKILCCLPIG